MSSSNLNNPLRLLITALGGEGGGTLMNWLVAAARDNGLQVQATSVPGVAQRTGSTSYYLEISRDNIVPVFNLVPMPGRVDIVLCSELMEAARVLEAGYVSPDRTVLIASNHRVYATAEKIIPGDGRYNTEAIETAASELSHRCHLTDLQKIADDNGTFISATLYGALAGSGALPWDAAQSRHILERAGAEASISGFDAAVDHIVSTDNAAEHTTAHTSTSGVTQLDQPDSLSLQQIMSLASTRLSEYQDSDYAALYQQRMRTLIAASDAREAVLQEAARRLANWMAYEDIARVAELKTDTRRFADIREQCNAHNDQIIRITEYLKPRAEEIADMLPVSIGQRLMRRAEAGKPLPFLGRGRRIPSNAAWGYWLLRLTATLKRWRRRSLRYQKEQHDIEQWLSALVRALPHDEVFALNLAELPRLRKGYSDTQQRGLRSFRSIMETVVLPTLESPLKDQRLTDSADTLRSAIDACLTNSSPETMQEAVINLVPKQALHTH